MTGGRSALWVDEGIADTIALKATQFIARHKDEPFSSIWEPTTCMCRVFLIPALRARAALGPAAT